MKKATIHHIVIDLYNNNIQYFQFQCIASDPRFDAVCLNPTVLDVAYFAYKQTHKPKRKFSENEKYRYTAYRQFVRYVPI